MFLSENIADILLKLSKFQTYTFSLNMNMNEGYQLNLPVHSRPTQTDCAGCKTHTMLKTAMTYQMTWPNEVMPCSSTINGCT